MKTTTITVRDVPDDVRDELAARAASSGRSLQAYLLRELEALARRPSLDSWLSQVQRRVERTGDELVVDEVLAARDDGRR